MVGTAAVGVNCTQVFTVGSQSSVVWAEGVVPRFVFVCVPLCRPVRVNFSCGVRHARERRDERTRGPPLVGPATIAVWPHRSRSMWPPPIAVH